MLTARARNCCSDNTSPSPITYHPPPRMTIQLDYNINDVRPYINWIYFFHAWSMNGKPEEEKEKLRKDAETMLDDMSGKFRTHVLFAICRANSDGDDIVMDGIRLPMLRQQATAGGRGPFLSLADFVRPKSQGIEDKAGVFMATTDRDMEKAGGDDPYSRMLAQTLSDRLAEATVEKMHLEVRKHYWGYAKDEDLSIEDLLNERFTGIRPAVGYPSLPDTGINFIIHKMLGARRIGIRLTQSGMMIPHASVSGLMIAHPEARYFSIGKIGEDQLADYASRRGIPVETARRFLMSNLI